MIRMAMLLSLVAVVGLVADQAFAADKGGVTGMVLDLNGKPLAGFQVKLVKDVPISMGRPGRGTKGKSGGTDSGATGLQAGGTKTIATTTTDQQGKFAFNNIEVGDYRLEGGNNNMGWLYVDAKIEANKVNDVGQQKLVKL
jgi:hypothetical protein